MTKINFECNTWQSILVMIICWIIGFYMGVNL